MWFAEGHTGIEAESEFEPPVPRLVLLPTSRVGLLRSSPGPAGSGCVFRQICMQSGHYAQALGQTRPSEGEAEVCILRSPLSGGQTGNRHRAHGAIGAGRAVSTPGAKGEGTWGLVLQQERPRLG